MIRTLLASTIVATLLAIPKQAVSHSEDARVAHCQAIYNEVWVLREKGKRLRADRLHARARHYGCFDPPIGKELCPILFEHEIVAESDGDTGLAGVIRAQMKRFNCT